jgi:CheY-like chemotaxis protein
LRTKNTQTVLLVEDIEWIRQGMRRNLQRLGYNVVEAANAFEAVEAARATTPEVIVTEEMLPTLGALAQSVREAGPLRGVPVAIINPDEEEGARFGVFFVLADYDRLETLISGARH